MKVNMKPPEYRECTWTPGERKGAICQTLLVMIILCYFFYRSAWAIVPFAVLGLLYFKKLEKKKVDKRKDILLGQFRECILGVATLLQAGYSLENAFVQEREEMEKIYGRESDICRELSYIRRGLHINIAIEDLLDDFAGRSACEDIIQFAQVVMIAKRSGGDLSEIMENTARRIGKKIELQKEIQSVLSGRKMELNVMKGIPFAILLYINLGNPGYFDVLYHNTPGVFVMTVCLAVFVFAVQMGERILCKIGEAMVSS